MEMIRITMCEDMARAVLNAVELSMRLRLNQPEEICWKLMNLGDEDFCDKRDEAEPILKQAFNIIFPHEEYAEGKRVWKDDEWYRLYNVYQMMNECFGRSNYRPMQMTDVPLPKVEKIEEKRSELNGKTGKRT